MNKTSTYFLIPVVEHGNAIEHKTESREIRENWVRVSDGRNGIKLRTIQVDQKWRGRGGVKLTKGSLRYQLANR